MIVFSVVRSCKFMGARLGLVANCLDRAHAENNFTWCLQCKIMVLLGFGVGASNQLCGPIVQLHRYVCGDSGEVLGRYVSCKHIRVASTV